MHFSAGTVFGLLALSLAAPIADSTIRSITGPRSSLMAPRAADALLFAMKRGTEDGEDMTMYGKRNSLEKKGTEEDEDMTMYGRRDLPMKRDTEEAEDMTMYNKRDSLQDRDTEEAEDMTMYGR